MKKNQEKYFDENASRWVRDIQPFEEKLIEKSLHTLGITTNHRVLDIGCGTGILYPYLKKIGILQYRGIDISQKMLHLFRMAHPEVDLLQLDVNGPISEQIGNYDYVIIYNSIPHFHLLDDVFHNVNDCLEKGGIFSIIHARSRQGLLDHHERIGYQADSDPIPCDERLKKLCQVHGFELVGLQDDSFFYFSCRKA